MFVDLILLGLALSGSGGEGGGAAVAAAPAPPAAMVAEDQTPTGQFTTAAEVKPILTATKASWVAVRDFGGQDLVYVTHLWAWRCGLVRIELALDGGAFEEWPLPICHEGTAQPNAILAEDGEPYRAFPPGSVQRIEVRITYDDLSEDSAGFDRARVLLP